MNLYEIPLSAAPQTFSVSLAGVIYTLTLIYRNAPMGGWVLDIADTRSIPIVCGIPLVTGTDLLVQYAYLGFGGALVVYTDGGGTETPTFSNIGTDSHLYFVTEP